MEELFVLYGRNALRKQAETQINELSDEAPSSELSLSAANILSQVASVYPSIEGRKLAADATRIVIGKRLPLAGASEARALIQALSRVAGEDKLLPRDAFRYLEQRPKSVESIRGAIAIKTSGKKKAVSIVGMFHLGVQARWKTALSMGSTIYALGVRDNDMIVVRGNLWCDAAHPLAQSFAAESEFRLRHTADLGLIIIPLNNANEPRQLQVMPALKNFFTSESVGMPSIFPDGRIFDASTDEQGVIWVVYASESDSNLLLSAYTAAGEIRVSQRTPLEVPQSEKIARSITLFVRSDHICLTYGVDAWVQAYGRSQWRVTEMKLPVVSACAPAPHTRIRIAIAFEEGACLFWPGVQQTASFGQQLINPALCILQNGTLFAAGKTQGMLYQIQGNDLLHLRTFPTSEQAPMAVTPTHNAGEFAQFLPDDAVKICRIT